MDCVVVLLIGPKEADLARLRDLLASLARYEPPGSWGLVLVKDRTNATLLAAVLADYQASVLAVLQNPREALGRDWTGNLSVGIATGLHWIATHARDLKFVLKLDADTLIIDPFIARVNAYFSAHPEVGAAGSHENLPGDRGPIGTRQEWAPIMRKLSRPLWLWRTKPVWRWQFGFWGRARRLRCIISTALAHGYSYGENCQGGGYVISRAALLKMEADGLLQDPLLFFRRPIPEEMAVGVLIRAAGFSMADFNRRGEVFAVQWLGLCASPEELVAEGYAIIHSVKDHLIHMDETGVRQFFAAWRAESPGEKVALDLTA